MKKIIIVLIAFAIVGFAGCSIEDEKINTTQQKNTSLKIINQSGYELLSVRYSSVDFGDMSIGANKTMNVAANSTEPIYFNIKINNNIIQCRTDSIITCDEGLSKDEIINNNTDVRVIGSSQSGSLDSVYNSFGEPIFEFSQSDTVIENDSPVPFDYGIVAIDSNKTIIFSIKNIGNVPLELNGSPVILSSNPVFTIPSQPVTTSISPGASISFILFYTPVEEGSHSSDITIMNNSAVSIFTFKVTGVCIEPKPLAAIYYEVNEIQQDGVLDAGEVILTLSKLITVIIQNDGTAPLIVENFYIDIIGAEASAFTKTTIPRSTIQAGTSSQFIIDCKPIKLGENNAVLVIPNNDTSRDPVIVNLKVTGVTDAPDME